MKKLLVKLLMLVMIMNLIVVPVYAEDAAKDDKIQAFVNHVMALSEPEEFVDLLLLIREVDEQAAMLDAYEAAFSGLAPGQQARLESFGATLDAMKGLVNFVMDDTFSISNLETYLGLNSNNGNTKDPDAFYNALFRRKAEFNTAMAGVDLDDLNEGFARMGKLFSLTVLARELKTSNLLAFLETPVVNGDFTLNRTVATRIITIANTLLDDKISNAEPVIDGINQFVVFYNNANDRDQARIFAYLDQYGFINIIPVTPPVTPPVVTPPVVTPPAVIIPDATIPEADTEIEDEEIAQAGMPFTDLGSVPWAFDAITELYLGNIVKGKTATTFEPNSSITRAEFSAFVTRLLDLDIDIEVTTEFTDIKETDWFALEVSAAYNAGIVNGVGDNKFEPNRKITRQEMATMLGRVLNNAEVTPPTEDEFDALLAVFDDAQDIQDFALSGAAFVSQLEIIMGSPVDDKVMFYPKKNATRAEAVVMLHRLSKHIVTVLTVVEETE
jgi:hypothetical protein